MGTAYLFYICPVCFNACEDLEECHQHLMIRCEPGAPDHERRKPVMDATGRIQTRAPRWFLEAIGWVPPERSSGEVS